MVENRKPQAKLYWTIGSSYINGDGQVQKFYGVIWDAIGNERWVGSIHDNKQEALDETTTKMMEMIKNG